MRQSSFESQERDPVAAQPTAPNRGSRPARTYPWGAFVVALVAFFTLYRNAGAPNPVSVDSSWITVLSHAFAQGWQWGSEIVSSYGPLGFLTPYFGWESETASAFRIGQIVLCGLSALLLFVFARGKSGLLQGLLVVGLLAWYPLLVIDIGWAIPFVFAVVMIHDMLDAASLGQPRRWIAALVIALLTLLAMTSYNAMLMWVVVMAYATLASALGRDWRWAGIFGVGAPTVFIVAWLTLGQSLPGLIDFVATASDLRSGYSAMSSPAPPYVDLVGISALLMLVGLLAVGWKVAPVRRPLLLASVTLFALSFLAWRAGFIRADQHVLIFFGTTCFIALAGLSLVDRTNRLAGARFVLAGVLVVTCLAVSYGRLGVGWSLAGIPDAIAGLFQPAEVSGERQRAVAELATGQQLPRTQARVGLKAVDVLMNEPSIALINKLNYRPRPAYLGYSAYTPRLTRVNEAHLLSKTDAPEFLLTKLQSFDNRLPTGDDPSSVLAALRAYIPVDMEGGYLVMKRAGWDLAPLAIPPAAEWKLAGLGADLDIDQGPRSKVLFFDIRLSFWGRIRAAIFREPGLSLNARLTDGSEQSFSLIRQLGPAGMLVSPFVLSESEYLRWHAAIFERRIVSLQLRATDTAEVRWFDPIFAYAIASIDLPRRDRASLTPELKSLLYPGISPAPVAVESPSEQVVQEGGRSVLFVHAPSKLTFSLPPGEWVAKGEFGLLSTATDCAASDGIALVIERSSSHSKLARLFEREIDPVHNASERGDQSFTLDRFEMREGDSLMVRGTVGSAQSAKADCDWMYLGPVLFEQQKTPGRVN